MRRKSRRRDVTALFELLFVTKSMTDRRNVTVLFELLFVTKSMTLFLDCRGGMNIIKIIMQDSYVAVLRLDPRVMRRTEERTRFPSLLHLLC
jgi:hypothetical protein